MEFLFILFLIVINGLLSTAEIAMISVKKARLQQLLDEGDSNAELVIKLAQNPNRLFSTIQVGITLIGILTGALSGLTLSQPVADYFIFLGLPQGMSETSAVIIVVVVTTYLSIVIGELVPKRIGLQFPEKVALLIAGPMNFLATVFAPIVDLLGNSTEFILNVLHIKHKKHIPVTEEEIMLLIREGTQTGVFETTERNMIERTLNLAEISVTSLMTNRDKIIWIDKKDTFQTIKDIVLTHQFSYYPICDEDIDTVKGIVSSDSLLSQIVSSNKIDLNKIMLKPVLLPENKKVLDVMELFKKTRIHMGLIIDEYGHTEGLITMTDILENIVGDLPDLHDKVEKSIIKKNNTTWFVDGLVSINEFKEHFDLDSIPNEETGRFNTIGGFVMDKLEKVPMSGDEVEIAEFKIQVVDMDGNRVDKIMVTKVEE